MPEFNISATFPGEALVVKILDLITKQQEILLIAPPEYRNAYFERLGKMEDFWFKLVEPLGDLIVRAIKKAEENPKK